MVLGVSADSPERQKKFKDKYDLPFTLLADTDKKLCHAYGVIKEKNMYGKKVMGIERTTFLISPEGRIARIFPKVKPDGHAEEVLAALALGRRGPNPPRLRCRKLPAKPPAGPEERRCCGRYRGASSTAILAGSPAPC